MATIAQFTIDRQPDSKLSAGTKKRGVWLEPVTPEASGKARSPEVRGAAGRILPERILASIKERALPLSSGKRDNGATAMSAENRFAALHASLHQAWQAKNAVALEAAASAHLAQKSSITPPQAVRIALEIYQFFKAKGLAATTAELLQLAGHFTRAELEDFLDHSAELVSEIKAQALAAIVNGTLVHQEVDLIFQINAILAFEVVAQFVLDDRKEKPPLPIKIVREMLQLSIYFPEWTFDIDPCRWHDPAPSASDPRRSEQHSPLKERLAKLERGKATGKVLEDTIAANQGRGEGNNSDAKSDESSGGSRTTPTDGKTSPVADHYSETAPADGCSCEGDLNAPCLPPDPCCAKINYFITDTLVLRDRTVRYVASDLAYIENIAASESRTREHRFIKSIEDYTEEETTTTKSEERDHQVSEKSSVQSEIESSLKATADMTAKYDAKAYSLELNASLSKESALKEAREQVREVVDKAVTKVQVQNRKLTSRRVTTTEEEKNTHSFVNTKGDHIVAKYFYVSKEVEGQVLSHGPRATVELLIPSPAALYEHLEQVKLVRGFKMAKPTFPEAPNKWQEVAPEKYEDYKLCFKIDELEAPLVRPAIDPISKTYQGKEGSSDTVSIPDGYYISGIQLVSDPSISFKGNNTGGTLSFTLNGNAVWYGVSKKGTGEDTIDRTLVKTDLNIGGSSADLQITTTEKVESYSAQFICSFSPLPVDHEKWQRAAFAKIRQKIDALMAEYDAAFAKYSEEASARRNGRHPFADKEIILAELKRAAIYMMCQDFERTGVMNMKSQPCGYPEINRKAASETCWDWYFWERAFDWRLMSFVFFDYFWNRPCDWPEKFDPGHGNFMFNSFKRAGMARILVPVSPPMTGDVIFYLQTGQKWGFGGTPPVNANDPRWVSVVEEIKHSHDCYQNDREGKIEALLDPVTGANTAQVLLKGSDRYWNPLTNPGTLDQDAINTDIDREIFIDGIAYRIQNIEAPPQNFNAHPYDPAGNAPTMWWIITLDRIFEGEGNINAKSATSPTAPAPIGPSPVIMKQYPYAIGAEFVGAPFRWQEPTNLVWIGDVANTGLPSYPVRG